MSRRSKTRIVALMVVLIAITILPAVYVHSATLSDAVQTAFKNNPELQILRHEEEAAQAQLMKAKLPFPANPTIGGSLSAKDKPVEAGGGKYTNYTMTLSQEFEVAGQRGLRIDVAQTNLSRIRSGIRDKERMLIYGVKEAYARALSLKKREELTKRVVRLQEELVDFTRIKYKAGSVSGLEVNLAEVELGKAKRDLLSVERDLKEALLALQGLMGVTPVANFTVQGELSPGNYVMPDKDILKERAASMRPDLQASSAEVTMTSQAVDLFKREAIPNVTLGGFQTRDEQLNERGLIMSVSIPLFDRKQAEIKSAEARGRQARVKLAGTEKSIEREIEDVYNNLTLSLQELAVFKEEILSKSMETLDLLNFAFKEGKISFFEVRTAQKDTLEMQYAYLDTVLQAQRWIYAVERVTGGEIK